jgi:hypothetical protein
MNLFSVRRARTLFFFFGLRDDDDAGRRRWDTGDEWDDAWEWIKSNGRDVDTGECARA